MVFSFFKKKEQEPEKVEATKPRIVQPKPPAGASAPATAKAPVETPARPEAAEPAAVKEDLPPLDFSTMSEGYIEVVESSELLSPQMEEAAILYANDQVEAAIATLASHVESAEGHHALDTWLMLFDLYQITGRKPEFDDLALKFVVEFERTAPVWQGGQKPVAKPAPSKAAANSVILPENLTVDGLARFGAEIDKLLGTKGATLRCDFGRVKQIESDAAQAMLGKIQLFKKKGGKIQAVNATPFAALLRGRIEMMRREEVEEPFWLLLLEGYQMLGLFEEFENLAVDYAVTYEVSPPSWDASQQQKSAAEVAAEQARLKAEADAAAEAEEPEGFIVQGSIVGAADSYFNPMLDYARNSGEVRLDFAPCARVDFVSAGALLNALIQIVQMGKHIQIVGANELIVAMFRIMGITDVAKVVRKK